MVRSKRRFLLRWEGGFGGLGVWGFGGCGFCYGVFMIMCCIYIHVLVELGWEWGINCVHFACESSYGGVGARNKAVIRQKDAGQLRVDCMPVSRAMTTTVLCLIFKFLGRAAGTGPLSLRSNGAQGRGGLGESLTLDPASLCGIFV